jgi:F0F1-type ATP synthase alpha subunit
VCILYAGVRGYLDKMMTSEIGKFEKLFIETMRSKHQNILDTIRNEKQLTDKTDSELKAILLDFIPTAGLIMKA